LLLDSSTLDTEIALDNTCYVSNFIQKRLIGCSKSRGVHEHIIAADILEDERQVLLPHLLTVLAGINLDNSSYIFE
jgi:hypothetical protein